MSLKSLKNQWRRHPRLARILMASGVSLVTAAAGFWLCETGKMRRFLELLSDGGDWRRRRTGDEEPARRQAEYIYIKYHIYRESMRELQQKQEDDKKWISVIVNPIGKWWKAAKHSVAWRLLNIAQMGSQSERLKAVQQLICMDHLKDWDFRHLAQICDARTAVSLARCGADTRWFMPVHRRGCIKNPKLLLSELHSMLSQLRPLSCVDHFFAKYFPEQQQQQQQHQHQHQETPQETPQEQTIVLSTADMDLLREIISFLHHISKDNQVSANIIKEGGLVHLMELRKIFSEDNETLSTLCKVLANMSVVSTAVEHFFATGWIGVLAEWQQCPDLRLQVISAKAMANLDRDDPNQCIYPPNVYPLHPRTRTGRKPKADIIFVHGLMGGVFVTWRQRHRKPTELNIYGKNAFFTSQSKDLYVAAEQWRRQAASIQEEGRSNNSDLIDNLDTENEAETEEQLPTTVIQANPLKHEKIQRDGTMEFVKKLRRAELGADWEVVHPDIPLNASEHCAGTFSVSGNEWHNQDTSDEYTNCWPMEWLPDDYPDARIIGIDYTSALTEWSANFTKYCPCERGQGKFEVRASTLLERIVASDVGNDRPIVWIGHSMGGLLTKLILIKSTDSEDPKVQQLAKNTRGIVFLGTPHRGSPIAKWKQHMQMILSPSIEVKEMEENSPKLLEMHRRFMDCLHRVLHNVKVVSVAEGSPTMLTSFKFPLRIVTEESSRIDFGDYYLLNDDHLGLSKPIYKQSFLYQRLLHVIQEAVKERDPGIEAEEQGEGVQAKESEFSEKDKDAEVESNSGKNSNSNLDLDLDSQKNSNSNLESEKNLNSNLDSQKNLNSEKNLNSQKNSNSNLESEKNFSSNLDSEKNSNFNLSSEKNPNSNMDSEKNWNSSNLDSEKYSNSNLDSEKNLNSKKNSSSNLDSEKNSNLNSENSSNSNSNSTSSSNSNSNLDSETSLPSVERLLNLITNHILPRLTMRFNP